MSTTNKISIKRNTILKLNNVLIRSLSENELMDIEKIYYMMDSYVKSKESNIVGPMIQYSSTYIDDNGQVKFEIKLMVQVKDYIENVELPYEVINQIRVKDCILARFTEKEENLHYAYSKLKIYAFENDIKLKGDSYTVFVKNDENDILVDIFMEVQKEELTV